MKPRCALMVTMILGCCGVFSVASAQTGWCFTEADSTGLLLQGGVEHPYPHSIESAVIRVRVHDMQGLGGEGALSPAEIKANLTVLRDFFDDYAIHFNVLSIEDLPLQNYFGYLNIWGAAVTNSDPDVIDIFLTDPNFGYDGAVAGGIPGTFLIMFGNVLGTEVIAHEMGHCLGLYHTHETFVCAELPDGSNCAECGDFVCDTAANPTDLRPFVDPSYCYLLPEFYNMFPDYDPDPTNLMAYTPITCLEHVSEEQHDRMMAAIEHLPVLQAVVDHAEAVYDNKSGETGLTYTAQPYSAVGIDYENLVGQPRDYEDLFITMYDGGGELYRCWQINENGVPVFERRTQQAFPAPLPSNLTGTSHADYDNDGDLDLFVAGGYLNTARLYRNEGNGTFSDHSAILGTSQQLANVYAGAWADYDGDGWIDIYLCRGNGPGGAPEYDLLMRNEVGTQGQFVDATAAEGMTDGNANLTNSLGAVWADVTGDDLLDLFVVENYPISDPPQPQVHGKLFIHDFNTPGGFHEDAAARFPVLVDALQQMTSVDAADVDLDGDIDLVAGFEGILQGAIVYVNDGPGNFKASDAIFLPDRNGTSAVRFVDQDLDGRPDLLVTSSDPGTSPRYFRNTRNADEEVLFFDDTPFVFGADAGLRAEGLVSLDWNRDGDQDLFLGRPTTVGRHFYRATSVGGGDLPPRSTITLRLSSPVGVNNTAGIGARVTSTYSGHTLLRRVDGGSGRGGQGDLVLSFPVDQTTGTVPVSVVWPNGWQQPAQVPVHTPGGAPYVLLDDTNPTVDNASVSGYAEYDPVTEEMTFVFTWATEYGFDASLDKVTLDLSQVPQRCHPAVTEITPATPGAVHTYERQATGKYRHTLRWTGWQCEPNCTLPYTVTSAHRTGIASTSSPRNLKFTFCPNSL